MRIEAVGSDLKKLVASILPGTSKTTIPVLSMGWFRVNGDVVTATSTNLDQSMTANCLCDGEGEGLIHLPKLSAFLSVIPSGANVLLVKKDGQIIATCGDVKFNISTLEISDFPVIMAELVTGGNEWRMEGWFLHEAIGALLPACEHGVAARANLHGIWFQEARLAATDGLTAGLIPLAGVKIDREFLFPTESLSLLGPILSGEITLRLSKDGNALSVTNSTGAGLRTKLMEASAPPFDSVIPEPDKWVRAESGALLSALSQGAVSYAVERPKTKRIGIDVTASAIRFSSGWNGDEASGSCAADFDGGELSVGAKHSALKWAIESLDCDTVEIGFANDKPAIQFRSVAGDPKNIRIVMAMR